MDKADLEAVVAVAETGSVTAAARRLHVAQPAVSRRLQALERTVGAPLFLRGRHGAAPTAVGRALVERAEQALAAIVQAEQDTADAAAGRAGRLRVGTIHTFGADELPAALARFRAERPDVRIELTSSGDSGHLHRQVAAGELDVATAVVGDRTEPGTTVAWRTHQTFVVVVPDASPLSGRQVIRRDQLADQSFVALTAGEGLRVFLDELLADLGEPRISIETTDREMLLPLVAAGLGITIAPEVFARQRTVPGLSVRPLRPRAARPVGAVVADGRPVALVRAFLDVLRRTGRVTPPTPAR